MDIMQNIQENSLTAGAFILLYLVIFVAAKWAKDVFTPYKLNDELVEHDNLAIALTMAGYYLGMTFIFMNLLGGVSKGLKVDLLTVGGYSILGIVLLNLCRWINDKFILKTFCNIERLTDEQDVGVGAIQCAVYVATGLIASGALLGQGGWLTFLAFFALGQLVLVLSSYVYQWITPFDIHQEIANKNTSVGLAYAGTLVALGLILMNGVSGDFISWSADLPAFAFSSLLGLVLLPLMQWVMDRLVIPGKSLKKEIATSGNLGAGLLEAVISIGFAFVVIQLV